MKRIISIPFGFSVDVPDYNLVFNVSPFPIIKPIIVTTEPYEVEDHLVWVKLHSKHFGLFERKVLNINRCPTCGQEWHHENSAD